MSKLTSNSGFLDVSTASIYYEVAGEGFPLLLLHAGIADSRMWDDQFPIFAQHYRTIRYDLRGFGQSQWNAGTFASYEDPVALFHALDVQKAHVLGVSFGGKTALDFALTHSQLVASLVLVALSVGGEQPSEQIRSFFRDCCRRVQFVS